MLKEPVLPLGPWESRPVYAKAAIIGFLIVVPASLLSTIVGIVEENGSLWSSALIALVVSLVMAGLLLKYGRWLYIVAAVLGLAVPIVFGPVIFSYGLSYIDSFWDFTPALLWLVGGLLALVGGTVAFIQHRLGNPRLAAKPSERNVIGGIGLVVAALIIVSGILTMTVRDRVSAEEAAGAITLDMKDTQFRPRVLEVRAGQAVRLLVKNSDFTIHTFTMKELDVDFGLGGFSEQIVDMPAIAPAGRSFTYTCEVPGHEDMKGTLLVVQ